MKNLPFTSLVWNKRRQTNTATTDICTPWREGRDIDIKWYTDNTCVPRLAMDCLLGILTLHPGSDGYGYLQWNLVSRILRE